MNNMCDMNKYKVNDFYDILTSFTEVPGKYSQTMTENENIGNLQTPALITWSN